MGALDGFDTAAGDEALSGSPFLNTSQRGNDVRIIITSEFEEVGE
jgi:hypothetical protein